MLAARPPACAWADDALLGLQRPLSTRPGLDAPIGPCGPRHQHASADLPCIFQTPPCRRPCALFTQSLERAAKRGPTRARNGMLKTDGSTHFLHLPVLSNSASASASASQPALSFLDPSGVDNILAFGLGCVHDRIRATQAAFGGAAALPPLPHVWLAHILSPDSRYRLGRESEKKSEREGEAERESTECPRGVSVCHLDALFPGPCSALLH